MNLKSEQSDQQLAGVKDAATLGVGSQPQPPPTLSAHQTLRQTRSGQFWPPLFLILLLALIGLLATQRDLIGDWLASRSYHPSAAVQKLTQEDTMTAYARRLFYANKPNIEDRSTFNKHCSNTFDQVSVLGCFAGNRQGIYVYAVTDSRLEGIQQVTAAHEMLHQAYERLSATERKRVDTLLLAYSKTVTDPGLKDKIAAYQKTEPHDVVNEMHSVFGTEVSDLPPALEQYYKRYFTNRHSVIQFHAQYQQAFTERTEQIAGYDAQIASLKKQINIDKTNLDAREKALQTQREQLDEYAAGNQIATYNAAVPGFNSQVNAYKALVRQTNTLISQYNTLIDARNAIAVQEQQLQQAIDSHASTTTPQ